jgi:uncharacterized membrane protein
MRNLFFMKTCSACLVVLAASACGAPAGNNTAGNDANAVAATNEAGPAVGNEADGNAGNEANGNEAVPAAGNTAAAAEPPYRASGTEPFWSLMIGEQMVYDSADGPDITVATPRSQPTRSGPRYVTTQMTVHINQFRRCTEASGEERHDTVTVTIGAQTVTGCGGEVMAAAE